MSKAFLTDSQREQARLENNLRLLERGRGCREMGKILGISAATYNRRRQNPQTFTLQEIDKLCRNAKVDLSDFCGGVLYLGGD